jgi:hypothetical protein
VIEHLLSKHEALNSNPSTTKKTKTKAKTKHLKFSIALTLVTVP